MCPPDWTGRFVAKTCIETKVDAMTPESNRNECTSLTRTQRLK